MTEKSCDTYWGSHGCDLPAGHPGDRHVCGTRDCDGPCSEWQDGNVRFYYEDGSMSPPLPTPIFHMRGGTP
jgi:hypothetical protein